MPDQSPLIVPLVVEALVVNDAVRTGSERFEREEMQYAALRTGSREDIFKGDPQFSRSGQSVRYNGVYLKWRLPDAFTRGVQDNATGVTTYPAVPNRWLILRSGGSAEPEKLAAWIVESDFPNAPSDGQTAADIGSLYLPSVAAAHPPVAFRIGRNVRLDSTAWSEPGGTPLGAKLTAVAPGNPLFAAYQPHNNNVFSMIDPLHSYVDPATGKAPTAAAPAKFSYMVIGWFSDPSDDPLNGVAPAHLAKRLAAQDWVLPRDADATLSATGCMLVGMTTGVTWHDSGMIPGGPPNPLDGRGQATIAVAAGPSSVQALSALIALLGKNDPQLQPDLFEAIQLDLLGHLDDPDASAVLAERLRLNGFQAHDGGSTWTVADDPAAATPVRLTPGQQLAERTLLAALNKAQSDYEAAQRALAAGRRDLFLIWWKMSRLQLAPPPGGNPTGVTSDQAAAKLKNVADTVAALEAAASSKPVDDAKAGLAAALVSGRLCKLSGRGRFYQRTDPVVMISGAGAANIADRLGEAVVRFPSQTVSGIVADTRRIDGSSLTLPALDLSKMTGVRWPTALFTRLAQEFFFRDPGNAATIAAAVPGSDESAIAAALADPTSAIGVAPIGAGGPWTANPWKPLMLLWKAVYFPIAYGGSNDWTYDGDRYEWTGTPFTPDSHTLSGRSILTPQVTGNLRNRIKKLLEITPDMTADERANIEHLLDSVAGSTHWDLLSQALSGFNAQLTGRAPGLFIRPHAANVGSDPRLLDLIGSAGDYLPWITSGIMPFQTLRAGQFQISELAITDEWGQALYPFSDPSEAIVARPPAMVPQKAVLPTPTGTFIQLEPGLLQPARLDFDEVAATDDSLFAPASSPVNPICGWVLPNHLDNSLALYGPDGSALGEIGVGIDSANKPEVCWTAAPHSQYQSLADLAAGIPHLGPFAKALHDQGPDEFPLFLAAVDETLWTTQPAGAQFDNSLAVLLGRPLALVRARLQLTLDGAPMPDPSWPNTLVPAAPVLPTLKFGIELGSIAKLDDGLIGYFEDDQYGQFNVVQGAGATADAYLKPIGAGGNWLSLPFDGTTSKYVSMLVDPRAPVHAISGILPDVALSVSPHLVDEALAAIEVTFRVGPLFTQSRPAAAGSGTPPVLTMPLPKLKGGAWSWLQKEGSTWPPPYAVGPVDPKAGISQVAPVLRQGLLMLSKDLG